MQQGNDGETRSLGSREGLRQLDFETNATTLNKDRQQRRKSDNQWDYEEILEIIGFGKTQWILLLVSGLLTMTSMGVFLSVGLIGIASQCEFDVSQSLVISTYIWGCLSDVLGRRSVLIWSMLSTNLLQLIIMFVSNIWIYNVINFIIGISLGGILGPIYPYLSEFNTDKYRAVVINYSTMFVSITVMYVPAISWLVLSNDWSVEIHDSFTFKPWRLIILLSLLPGFIGVLILWMFPESPKLLLAHDKHMEALKALEWISKFNTGRKLESILKTSDIFLKPEELADANLLEIGTGCGVLLKIWQATVPLFHKPHGLNVAVAVIGLMSMMFSSSGMQVWFPEIVNRSAAGSVWGNSTTLCEILKESYTRDRFNSTTGELSLNKVCDDSIATKTYIDNIIMGMAFLVGFFIQGLLLQTFGRKKLLLAALSVGALCGILLNFVTNSTGILILLCLFVLIPGLSVSIMCGVIVDLVPTHLRGKAVSLAFTLGRLGTIIATNLIAGMLEPYCSGLFALITCVVLVCVILVYYLPF
ncbi:hypothetical protein DOY81_007714 [Sarcophaga bullata]|nr:hypothetical protein DOY81_007714 [Sarcophaga bullata]